jgi:hypothetical protein
MSASLSLLPFLMRASWHANDFQSQQPPGLGLTARDELADYTALSGVVLTSFRYEWGRVSHCQQSTLGSFTFQPLGCKALLM